MIKVKEFLNYQESQEYKINNWLIENDGKIDVIDIKYSVSAFQNEDCTVAQEFSGVLIIYKEI